MRLLTASIATALALSLPLADEAAACVLVPLTTIGPNYVEYPAALARLGARRMTAARRETAARELEQGADAAAQLAEMLVPNVHPTRIERSDCGPSNEIDHADGEEAPDDWLVGTRFAGRADEFEELWYDFRGETLGTMCNAEFRSGFAAHLRRRLTEAELREAYLSLASRWERIAWPHSALRRLTAFEGSVRRPPLRWTTEEPWQEQDIRRWMRRTSVGQRLKAAIDEFWAASEPLLGDARVMCPGAVARWPAAQAQIVAMIEARIEERRQASR